MSAPDLHIPRIFVCLLNAYTTHAGVLRGILDYTRSHTPWAFDLKVGRRGESGGKGINWGAYDGAIVNHVTPDLQRQVTRHGLPVILVNSDARRDFPGCVLHCDNAPIAATAADFLLARDYASYAFLGVAGALWSQERGRGFADAVCRAGGMCLNGFAGTPRALARRIAAAPKPLGIFAADDIRARAALDACRAVGCVLPDDVAILGVDDDETLCEFSSPTLSSIPLSTHAAGFEAARILDRAIRGEFVPATMPNAVYTGTTVVARQSTARTSAHDALVRRCREMLAAHFMRPLSVDELARALCVSRRTLELRFRRALHTSITAEIQRLRIERAQKLLAETEQSQEQIAVACGFYDASHLGATFRRLVGKNPSAFRRAAHGSGVGGDI